ncbi:MAG: hypothetical protein HN478_20890 [Rhodospirillaceae bacterium]|nr:hypothetical protein [Rhodospirillaceae bacterium]
MPHRAKYRKQNEKRKMNTLHRVRQADILAALDNKSDADAHSIIFSLAVNGDWTGEGQIELAAPSGSSTGPFHDIISFSFRANSSFGSASFGAIDLAFAYWNVGPTGSMASFSILTNQVDGFSLSVQLGQDAAKLEGRKFATLEVGTLTHSVLQDGDPIALGQPRANGGWLRSV